MWKALALPLASDFNAIHATFYCGSQRVLVVGESLQLQLYSAAGPGGFALLKTLRAGGGGGDGPAPLATCAATWGWGREVYGAVGTSSGRVHAFQSDGYVLAFEAHKSGAGVVAVAPVLRAEDCAGCHDPVFFAGSNDSPLVAVVPTPPGGDASFAGRVTPGGDAEGVPMLYTPANDGGDESPRGGSVHPLLVYDDACPDRYVTLGTDGVIRVATIDSRDRARRLRAAATAPPVGMPAMETVALLASFIVCAATPFSGAHCFSVSRGAVVFGGPGRDDSVHVVSAFSQDVVEEPLPLGGWLDTTAAVSTQGAVSLVGRGCRVFAVNHATRAVVRLAKTPAKVTTALLALPFAFVALADGQILVLSPDNGAVLAKTCTPCGARVVSLSYDDAARVLCVVDATGGAEALALPPPLLRHGEPSFVLQQAVVMRRLVAAEEEAPAPRWGQHPHRAPHAVRAWRGRTSAAEEGVVLARLLVPEAVGSLLSRTQAMAL